MILYKLFSYFEALEAITREIEGPFSPPFDIKYVIWWPFCFQNKAKIILRQAFLAIYISVQI